MPKRRSPSRPAKPTLSPTRIAAYLECAMKYRYIYHDKVGRYYLRAQPSLSLGSTLHNVLRAFHEEGAVHTSEELVARMEEKWVSAGFESTQQEQTFREAGATMVQAYREAHEERALMETETILSEKQIKTDMGAFWLAGRIDRVDRHPDGALEVIDYKSGRWETSSEEVASDLAMNIYQLILRRNNSGIRVFATIYCLRSGIQASAEMTEEEAVRFGADMQAVGEEILSRDFENLEPARIEACEWCEFIARCERFWRWQERRESIRD
jgi:RecB family exonuclease